MRRRFKLPAAAVLAGLAAAGGALATPVVGEDFSVLVTNSSGDIGPLTLTVTDGVDWTIGGTGSLDVNGGGDGRTLSWTTDDTYPAIFAQGEATQITFTLPLAPGDAITGAAITLSQLADAAASFTGSVLTVTLRDGPVTPGTVFAARLRYASTPAIPVPAAALLFAPAALLAAFRSGLRGPVATC